LAAASPKAIIWFRFKSPPSRADGSDYIELANIAPTGRMRDYRQYGVASACNTSPDRSFCTKAATFRSAGFQRKSNLKR